MGNWLNGNRTQISALNSKIASLEAENASLNGQIASYLTATNGAIPSIQQIAPRPSTSTQPRCRRLMWQRCLTTAQSRLSGTCTGADRLEAACAHIRVERSGILQLQQPAPFEPEPSTFSSGSDTYGNVDCSFTCNIRSTPTAGIYGVESTTSTGQTVSTSSLLWAQTACSRFSPAQTPPTPSQKWATTSCGTTPPATLYCPATRRRRAARRKIRRREWDSNPCGPEGPRALKARALTTLPLGTINQQFYFSRS